MALDLTFGWGAILGPMAALIGDKVIMRHADKCAQLEKQIYELENAPYDDQDDLAIQRTKELLLIEKKALQAQILLKGGTIA